MFWDFPRQHRIPEFGLQAASHLPAKAAKPGPHTPYCRRLRRFQNTHSGSIGGEKPPSSVHFPIFQQLFHFNKRPIPIAQYSLALFNLKQASITHTCMQFKGALSWYRFFHYGSHVCFIMTYETASIQSKAGDFPVNDRISIGAVHRQARSSHLLWRPSTFHVCCASYCFIKGVQALCFSSILRYVSIS